MRLQLKLRAAAVLGLMLVVTLGARGAWAANQVTVRGQYYREPSTRVIQPVVAISSDVPGGIDVGAHYLLDAITSASAAAGPDGDNIFTEYRNESGIVVGKSWSRLRIGAAYKYSAESDYWSHTLALSATLRTWADTGTLALSAGLGRDQVGKRTPGNADQGTGCVPSSMATCLLESFFGGVGYSQVFSPTFLVQGGYELAVLNGYQASPYRAVPPFGDERVPRNRVRHALSARGAKYFPSTGTGIQLQYRYYWDVEWDAADPFRALRAFAAADPQNPWQVRSHTVEGRVFQSIGRELELRFTARYYSQAPANLWCDQATNPGCYTGQQLFADGPYRTADPKLTPVATVLLDAKVYWQATRWRGAPFFGWFSEGTFELSYGRFIQNTSFRDAHLLQAGYSLPF